MGCDLLMAHPPFSLLCPRAAPGAEAFLVPDQLDVARSTQPSSRGRAAQLEWPRSRSAAALTVRLTQPSPRGRAPRLERPRTPRAAASLGPRLARNLARHSAGSREVWGILVGDALAAVRPDQDQPIGEGLDAA